MKGCHSVHVSMVEMIELACQRRHCRAGMAKKALPRGRKDNAGAGFAEKA